ncbi:MAG: hypothetical protein K2K57_05590 [Oscillospiraceae bacterium]|nr:hypothetical protein [Oscillospiraceae bacterium]
MSKTKAPDCIRIFYPKRGVKKYIGFPLIAMLILIAGSVIITLLIKNSGDKELQEFLILQNFLALYGIPAIAAILEIVSEWVSTMQYAGKSPKRLILLRTAPEMEWVLKNAFVFDEIRKAVFCIITAALSAAAAGLTGQHSSEALILWAVFTAANMYFISVIATVIVRFIDNITAMTILVYLWLAITGGLNMLFSGFVLDGSSAAMCITLALILGMGAGIITCAAAIKRACSCRQVCGSRHSDETVKGS